MRPAEVGAELRDDYWLTNRDMAMLILVVVMAGRLLQWIMVHSIPEAQNAPHFSPLTSTILGIFAIIFGFAMYWFVVPAFDKWGYRILGVRLTYAKARQVYVANYFVALSPVLLGMIILGIVSFKLGLFVLGALLFLALGLIAIVQSVRLRKHLLEISATKAFFGPMVVPALIILPLIAVGFLVGAGMVHKAEDRRAHAVKMQLAPEEPTAAVGK